MSFVMVDFLLGLFSNTVISNLFNVNVDLRLSSAFICVVVEDCMGEGRFGPTGVHLSVWKRWSMEVPEALAVDSGVFIVLIWHYMKSLDLGYMVDEVKWSIPCVDKNLEKGSEEKGSPLSEENHLGIPYWEKRPCKHCLRMSEVLEWTLYTKGY